MIPIRQEYDMRYQILIRYESIEMYLSQASRIASSCLSTNSPDPKIGHHIKLTIILDIHLVLSTTQLRREDLEKCSTIC